MIRKIKAKGCNVYLIKDKKTYIIDTGLPGSTEKILSYVKSCDGVILTHSHFDHMGCAYELSARLGCKVYAHPDEFAFIKGEREFEFKGILGFFAKTYEKVKRPKYLDEVYSVDELEIDFVHAPGHTPGSIVILVEGKAICGDLVRGRTFFSRKVSFSSNSFNWSADEYRKSLKKVLKFEFSELLPGHGENVSREEFEKLLQKLQTS